MSDLTGEYLMITRSYIENFSLKSVEANINVNAYYKDKWANSALPGHFDVQSSLTHEFGHVLGVNDKYESWTSEWTMGIGTPNSIKQRTLDPYDIRHATSICG